MKDQSQLNALREALRCSPENVPLLKLFGEICLDHWALGEALETFEKVLKLKPEDRESRLGVAKVLFQMGKISEAMVRTEALTAQEPGYARAWVLLSRLYLSEGSVEAARSHYQKARGLDAGLKDDALEKDLSLSAVSPPPSDGAAPSEKLFNTEYGAQSDPLNARAAPPRETDVEIVERPMIYFKDVGGMEAVKEEIRMKIIHPLNHPEVFKAYGKKAGGGVLLYGPPGCGKTMISRATAGEIKANFIAVGLHQILDMYVGNSEKNLHDIFELARSHRPSVIFVDEIDALATDRRDLKRSASRTLINQFLAEMDGSAQANEGILVLGATNAPWDIDPAFRRPGRFDRIIFVPPPDDKARAEIIQILMRGKPVDALDVKELAQRTKDFTGADLTAVFDVAIEQSLSRAMRETRVIPLTMGDLLNAAKSVNPSGRAWFESAKNYALFANQSGFYDPILSYLGIKR